IGHAWRGASATRRSCGVADAVAAAGSGEGARRRAFNAAALAEAPMQSFEANGVITAYHKTGHGAPLVLLHGGEADHAMFDGLATALNDHFTVVAYDQRDSGATRNPAAPYSLADLADDAAALIHGLGYDRTHVMGTSLGGLIA